MKPLIVLVAAFALAYLTIWLFGLPGGYRLAMKTGMAIMLLFTAMGHFAFTKGMAMMVPAFIPFKKELVYITGLFEIAAAIGLLIPRTACITAIALIIFFILMLPANIYAALKKVDYQKGNYQGSGVKYLWFRVPLQVFFILWVYFSAL